MPYIKKETRNNIDGKIRALVEALQAEGDDNFEGVLNYTISEIINHRVGKDGWRYKKINAVVGVLDCVKLEYYRRVAGPYETHAIYNNGDLDSYEKMSNPSGGAWLDDLK